MTKVLTDYPYDRPEHQYHKSRDENKIAAVYLFHVTIFRVSPLRLPHSSLIFSLCAAPPVLTGTQSQN